MDDFRSNDPLQGDSKKFQAQPQDMALTVKVEARKKTQVFFPVVCNHIHCKELFIWMGWEVSQKNCKWLVDRKEGKMCNNLIQKGFHKGKETIPFHLHLSQG